MANPYVNKVAVNNHTIIDLTADTVDAEHLLQGYTAHDKSGAPIVGTASGGGDECDLYAGKTAPSAAVTNDLWLDTSDDGRVPSVIIPGWQPVLTSEIYAYTRNATSMAASGIYIIVPKAGTYGFVFSCARTATSGTFTAQLYKNGSAVSGATATWNSRQGYCYAEIQCNVGDRIEIYCRSGSTSNYTIVGMLVAFIDWDIWG